MTNTQRKITNEIKSNILSSFYGHTANSYEIKQFNIDECSSFISLVAETGLINDEGTMAAIFCRQRLQLLITKRGKTTYYDFDGNSHNAKNKSLYSIYFEQNYSNKEDK